jgi:hypothetical protein
VTTDLSVDEGAKRGLVRGLFGCQFDFHGLTPRRQCVA